MKGGMVFRRSATSIRICTEFGRLLHRFATRRVVILLWFLVSTYISSGQQVIQAKAPGRAVEKEVMQQIYGEVKTPYKYGLVLVPDSNKKADCPSVFRFRNRWYMTYIVFDGTGYETHLAGSKDLLHWNPLGKILSFSEGRWDDLQKAGYMALVNYDWNRKFRPEKFRGEYWMSYIGGKLKGYETDPLSIGLARTKHPAKAEEWSKLPEPVLSPGQPDARHFEKLTLYKSNIIHDRTNTLGYPFVMFYNAKTKSGYERIGMAASKDMVTWNRYGTDPVIDNGSGISGDPQIVKIGNLWVMFYFGAFWKPGAFDTFACSYDLVNWTKWEGPDLIAPSEEFDLKYAHKPWVVRHKGIVYHFYCAVNKENQRGIAVAVSRDMGKSEILFPAK